MRFLALIMLVVSSYAYGSLEVYEQPSDKEIYLKSDVVAVVYTLSGEVIPLDKGGGAKVKVEVLEAIKGVGKG